MTDQRHALPGTTAARPARWGGHGGPPTSMARFRGYLHAAAAALAVPAGVFLVLNASDRGVARLTGAVFALGVLCEFTASAVYHRSLGTGWHRPWFRWVDHAMIFVLIAATYTPMVITGLRSVWRPVALTLVWTAAGLGVGMKMTRGRRFRRVLGGLYMAMGWSAVLALPSFWRHLSPAVLALMVTGGLMYSAGALVLYRRAPQLKPGVFGYHELWHAFVVAAAACHFAMVYLALHQYAGTAA